MRRNQGFEHTTFTTKEQTPLRTQSMSAHRVLITLRPAATIWLTSPDVSLRAAQKASRTKTPIADIKPASNAKSSTASIKRIVGSVFFRRFMVIRWVAPRSSTDTDLFVCKWAESFGFIQVQRIYRQVVSEEPFENPNHYGDDSAHGGANSKNPAAAEFRAPRRIERRQDPKSEP
ncbi:MAG: hypothetical protein QOH31_14 [Verrucomicrobiota bacterium]